MYTLSIKRASSIFVIAVMLFMVLFNSVEVSAIPFIDDEEPQTFQMEEITEIPFIDLNDSSSSPIVNLDNNFIEPVYPDETPDDNTSSPTYDYSNSIIFNEDVNYNTYNETINYYSQSYSYDLDYEININTTPSVTPNETPDKTPKPNNNNTNNKPNSNKSNSNKPNQNHFIPDFGLEAPDVNILDTNNRHNNYYSNNYSYSPYYSTPQYYYPIDYYYTSYNYDSYTQPVAVTQPVVSNTAYHAMSVADSCATYVKDITRIGNRVKFTVQNPITKVTVAVFTVEL